MTSPFMRAPPPTRRQRIVHAIDDVAGLVLRLVVIAALTVMLVSLATAVAVWAWHWAW